MTLPKNAHLLVGQPCTKHDESVLVRTRTSNERLITLTMYITKDLYCELYPDYKLVKVISGFNNIFYNWRAILNTNKLLEELGYM